MLESMKKVDKKILIMGGMVLGIVAIFVIAIIVVSLSSGGTLSYSKIESKLESAAESYYKDNSASLPKKVGESVEVDSDMLVSQGYIKDLTEFTEENVICSAKVIVAKTEDDYDYVAALDCGEEYQTTFLADMLIENEVVTSGNGLYKMEDVVEYGTTLGIDDDGYDLSTNELMQGYIYRGETVNNYIKLGDALYRIVKVDGDNDITVVTTGNKPKGTYDDRYNSEADREYGINDYTVSRAYESLTSNYANANEFIKKKITSKNICIGARSTDETSTDGSAECSVVMKDQHYSLLPVYDIMNASLSDGCETAESKECSNYNYLINEIAAWTMTPTNDNTYTAYRISENMVSSRTNLNASYRYVYYLSSRLVFTGGTGTEDDPYKVE